MPSSKRVTQSDVARAAGVDRTTVSLAMRDQPRIPEATRRRIKLVAEKMGYRPDPMLAALAAYRTRNRAAEFRGTLAWIAQDGRKEFRWRKIPHFMAYLAGANERAESLGYTIDVVDLSERGLSLERAGAILRSRGILGVLLCPQPRPDMDLSSFPWHAGAAVTFGYGLTRPQLNSVAAAQYRASMRTVRELHERGYRRIGFAFARDHDAKTDHNYFGGYLMGRQLYCPECDVPPLLYETRAGGSDGAFVKWFKSHRPDAVVIGMTQVVRELEVAGIRVPNDVGIACPLLSGEEDAIAGVVEDNREIGRAAVDMLVSMLHHGQHGLPSRPKRLLVEGFWTEGESLAPSTRGA